MNFPTPTTSLTAIATNSVGTPLGKDSIPITVDLPRSEQVLTLRAQPALGLAPLSLSFNVSGLRSIVGVELDIDGDGTIDFQSSTLDKKEFSLREPGLYYPTVKVTDREGIVRSDKALVQVLDQKELDALFHTKWNAMRNALKQGDITQAVNYIALNRRSGYRQMFEALTIPLANIDQALTEIKFVKFSGVRFEYEMIYSKEGTQFSGMVVFILDTDGVWRISFF